VQLFADLTHPFIQRVQYRLLAPVVHRFIAVSRHMADDLCHTFAIPLEKIRVVHNAVAAPAAAQFDGGSEPGLNRGGTGLKVVLTPARLHAQKGHRYLLEAALLVPDAIFVFAGDGPERTSLEDQSARLGLRDRVLFLGRRDDIPALLAQCDVCVLPSLSEGLPLAVLEAMAAGTPVIGCAVGGVPELVADGQTGLLVPPADPQALAGAIRCLLSNPGLARQLAAAGHARVLQDFSVSTMVARITAIYEELLEKTHARHRRAS
jgi:glycosyltransferase involved in cell wall biosynthesis